MFFRIFNIVLFTAPLIAASKSPSTSQHQTHATIKGEKLKLWLDEKKPIVVIDARSEPYFDGRLIPNAKWLPAESTEKEILAAIPDKNSLVVVYCAGVTCPASGWLYDKLSSMGYRNVYDYHEGLADWIQKGYPLTEQES